MVQRAWSWLLGLLRRFLPILAVPRPLLGLLLAAFRRFPRYVVVTRHADVVEVLARHRDFSVALYDQKFRSVLGPFFLGMDEDAQYRHEAAAARKAILPEDLPRIRGFVDALAERIVERGVHGPGRVDAIAELVNVVPVAFVGDYFGIPEPDPARPTLLQSFQTASYYMFNLDVLVDAPLMVASARCGGELSRHLEEMIAARKAAIAAGSAGLPDDVLGRFLRLQDDPATRLEDRRIRDTLAGIISGSLVPTIGFIGDAIDRLLDLPPDLRAGLKDACCAGDDDRVWRFTREAGRFSAFPPILYRYCELDTVIAEGTPRARRVPRGSVILAAISSAAFDAEVVEKPDEFRLDRPDSQYLLFGHGQHECLGATGSLTIAQALTDAIVKAIFRRDFRRADGERGRLRTRGARDIPPSCPESLLLTL